MILPESPKAFVIDGGLLGWGAFILAKGAPALITALTIIILALRAAILWRQWRAGK